MAPINLHGPLNGTDSLEGCRFFRSSGLHLYGANSLFSVNDKAFMNGTGNLILMGSHILRRRLFSICSHFFGANSLAKNVSEKQHVLCLQIRIQLDHPREHAERGGLIFILTGFSLADAPLRVSQTNMTTGGMEAGINRVWMVAGIIVEGEDEAATDQGRVTGYLPKEQNSKCTSKKGKSDQGFRDFR